MEEADFKLVLKKERNDIKLVEKEMILSRRTIPGSVTELLCGELLKEKS